MTCSNPPGPGRVDSDNAADDLGGTPAVHHRGVRLSRAWNPGPDRLSRHDGTAGTEHLDDHGLWKVVIFSFRACIHVTTPNPP